MRSEMSSIARVTSSKLGVSIDHHIVVMASQQVDHGAKVVRGNQFSEFRARGRQQHLYAGAVLHKHPVQ